MITINLLPLEFRKESGSATGRFWPPNQRIVKITGVFVLTLTAIFYVQLLFNLKTLKEVGAEWPRLHKEAQRVDQMQNTIEKESKKEKEFLEDYISPSVPCTKILSSVSEFLPDSIWLLELNIARKAEANTLLVKGLSLPTGERSSIPDIEQYLKALKGTLPRDTNLILTTSRQQKDKIELTLFTAVFKWR